MDVLIEIARSVFYFVLALVFIFTTINFLSVKMIESGKILIDYNAQVRETFYKGIRETEPKPSTFHTPHRQGTN